MNKRKTIVPNNLTEYRLKSGLRQKDVANILGFSSEERICHWEQGKNVPSLINFLKLCSIYQASPDQLYNQIALQINKKVKERIQDSLMKSTHT